MPSPCRAVLCLVLLAVAPLFVGCSELKSQGQQCVFNDDCVEPLVCAGLRCRVQCRSQRDCPAGSLCIPSQNPLKQVCVPEREAAVCGVGAQCPAGAVCLDNACWWSCRDDVTCATRRAGSCERAALVCRDALTARSLVDNLTTSPPDGGVDAPSGSDASAPVDVPDADSATAPPPDRGVALDGEAPLCAHDNDCTFVHALGACTAGRCRLGACMSGFADCDRDPLNGCEVTTADDVAHCGACNAPCARGVGAAAVTCAAGRCAIGACAEGMADCNGMAVDGCEVDTTRDVAHCGACRNACSTGGLGALAARCERGVCGFTMCAAGRGDCDREAANGCEADLLTAPAHCGACGRACSAAPNGAARCVNGACARTCNAGFADCDGDIGNGCETDTRIDPDHCARCANRCGGAERCDGSSCVAFPWGAGDTTEDFRPTRDVTLASGIHRFRSIVVPAGVRVRVGSPGVLELYARREVRIEGAIDVSGGRGGDGAVAATNTCIGGQGGGGETGTGVAGRNGNTMDCGGGGGGGGGLPGRNGTPTNGLCGVGGSNGGGAGGSARANCAGGGGGGGRAGGGGGSDPGTACTGGAGGGEALGTGTAGGAGGTRAAPQGGGGSAGVGLDVYAGGRGSVNAGGGGSIGPSAAGDLAVRTLFEPGSGGGGGAMVPGADLCATPTAGGAGGGGGGGALRVASQYRVVVPAGGELRAQGGAGGDVPSAGPGAGGGGSGGVLQVIAPAVDLGGVVNASGGVSGRALSRIATQGGAGGPGRIQVSVGATHCALTGAFAPGLLSGCSYTAGAGTPGNVHVSAIP